MRFALLAALLLAPVALAAADVPAIAPAAAARLVAENKAVLVDVREPEEWRESGVAQPAVLLAKSDFDGEQKAWKPFLAQLGDRQLILYCRTGRRSGAVAAQLAAKGIPVANAGGFKDWTDAGLPVRRVEEKK
jgi:rhodanese-related sulfurtransferase